MTRIQKLHHVIAVEKEIKGKTYSAFNELHSASKKPELFNGHSKTYKPLADDGEKFPDDSKLVQKNVAAQLAAAQEVLTSLFDMTATKDFANKSASADLVVDGKVLIKDAPTTLLLFLEKQLRDLRAFVSELPILDGNEVWTYDSNSGIYKSDVTQTHRTKKNQKPIVLYDATEKHPAQTQLITEDELVGYWNTTKQSGCIPSTRQKVMLDRIDLLSAAVKQARQDANAAQAPDQKIGSTVLGFIFGA